MSRFSKTVYMPKFLPLKKRVSAYKHFIKGTRIKVTDEGLECYNFTEWLRWQCPDVMFLHIPNEAKRDSRLGAMLKILGLEAGAADYLIFDSPPKFPTVKGVAIEMKTLIGKSTAIQEEWLRRLDEKGWIATVCYGANQAVDLLKELGYGERKPIRDKKEVR